MGAGRDRANCGAPNRRLTCFRATGPAPAPGELSFDFGAEQQADCAWSVFEYDGVDTSGVVQTKTLTGGATLSITLDPLADPATSVVIGGIISAPLFGFPTPIQPGAGMTEIHEQDVAEAGTGGSLQTEDRIGGDQSRELGLSRGLGGRGDCLGAKAGSSLADALELSKRFEPILFFHPEEKFLPSNAKRYIEKCALWKAEAPFDTKDSFGGMNAQFPRSPLIAKGSIAAIKTEPGTFLGDSLVESTVETRFLELGGWQDKTGMAERDVTATSNNLFANRDLIADQYEPGGALEDSTLWYHAEFLDNAKLRRLLSTVSQPELAKVLDSKKLKNPALLCYHFFFPAHQQPLKPSCTNVEAKDYAGFGGEWACVALLLEQDDPTHPPTLPCDLYWSDRLPALSGARRKPSAAGRG